MMEGGRLDLPRGLGFRAHIGMISDVIAPGVAGGGAEPGGVDVSGSGPLFTPLTYV